MGEFSVSGKTFLTEKEWINNIPARQLQPLCLESQENQDETVVLK